MRAEEGLFCARKSDFYLFDLTNQRLKACCKSPFPEENASLSQDLASILSDRRNLRRGLKVKSCQTCWVLEEKGHKSFRSTASYNSIKTDPEKHSPYLVEFIIGNICNLKCIYCNSASSSQWARIDNKRSSKFDNAYFSEEVVQLLKNWWDGIGILNFIGGEPLMTPVVFDLLSRLSSLNEGFENKPKKIVRILTNLSVSQMHLNRFIQMTKDLQSTFHFEIGISGESIFQKFEYIRDGASFSVFDQNLRLVLSYPHLELSFFPALSLLSVPFFDEYLDYIVGHLKAQNRRIDLNYNEVVMPRQLSPRLFPTQLDRSADRSLKILRGLMACDQTSVRSLEKMDDYIRKLEALYASIGESETDKTFLITHLDQLDKNHINKLTWREIFPELSGSLQP